MALEYPCYVNVYETRKQHDSVGRYLVYSPEYTFQVEDRETALVVVDNLRSQYAERGSNYHIIVEQDKPKLHPDRAELQAYIDDDKNYDEA